MHHRFTPLIVAAVAVLAACSDEPATAPRAGPLFATSATGAKTYVILGTGNTLPSDIAARVTAAGGALAANLTRIGVAVATSSDPGFAANLGRAPGVQAVAEDVMLDFGQPRVEGLLEADPAGEPGAGQTAVGALETFRAVQWAPDAVSAPAAWDAGYQGAGARVAILDGGIRDTHIDIAPNLDAAHSASFVPGQPYNFDQARNAQGACGVTDTFWHATHVAGIVAAPANNIGTVGIAPRATLIGVKVLHCGSGAFSWVMQGIYYAATPIAEGGAGANIINMSLGAGIDGRGAGIAHLLNALSRATSYANQRGVTVIASAGNDATDIDHTGNLVFVPAQSVGVIAVAATGPMGWALGATDLDRPASYTNYGQSAITFAGPGGDFALPGNAVCSRPRLPSGTVTSFCWVFDMVIGPSRGSGASISSYAWAAGTSMASPAVAGVAALIVGKFGPLPPAQVEARLRQSADDLGKPGNDDYYGRGRVNAGRAVQ
jgi:subtilisin family serine protease